LFCTVVDVTDFITVPLSHQFCCHCCRTGCYYMSFSRQRLSTRWALSVPV